jgi:pilus assembly protein FimV
MSRKLIAVGVLSLILVPSAALAVGLGDIRLNSHLNQPINAEIALSATPAELETLRVGLASSDDFRRLGLDRPAYFDDLQFRLRAVGPGSAVVLVSSGRPMVEPFLTFLVEARWSGGRALREYTVLLDPPVFLPAPEAAPAPPPAVAAPVPAPPPVVDAPAPVTRPAPAPAPPPVAAPLPVRTEVGADFGPVQRNDTLWAISQRVRPDPALTTNQVMMAIFRANPNAFDGNINRLRAGAILRIPSRDEMFAMSTGEATAEVRRQTESWQAAAPAPAERRLELAPPTDAPRPPAPVTDPAAPPRELTEALEQLRGELSETRRLVELRDAEIAALQSRLAQLEAEAVPLAAPVAPLPEAVELAPEAVEPAPVEAEPAPAPTPAPEAAPPQPAPAPVAPPAPSLMDRVFDTLGNLWLWILLALALVGGAVAVFLRRRQQEQQRAIEDDLAETGTWGALDEGPGRLAAAAAGAAGGAAAASIQPRRARADDLESILVEEAEPPPAPRAPEPVAAPPVQPEAAAEEDYHYPFEDTIAGETGINLDQSDPVAEADFHMAYGLYDQAADIVRKAVEREPDRYDLRRKLLDICFVWGNADEFLAQARAVREMGGEAQAADWPKIAIMGRQICPGEGLFSTTEAPAAVDVDFGGTQVGLAELSKDTSSSGEWLDFDVGESGEPLAAPGDTREQPGLGAGGRLSDQTAELDLEELGIDLDLGESGEHALKDLAEHAPEEIFEDFGAERTQRIEDRGGEGAQAADEEDDGGTLIMGAGGAAPPEEEPTHRGERLALDDEEPTLSGMADAEPEREDDETLLQPARGAVEQARLQQRGSPDDDTVLEEGAFDDDAPTLTGMGSLEEGDRTAEVGTIDQELDLDLDELTHMLEAGEQLPGEEDDDSTQLAESIGRRSGSDDDATMMAPGLGHEDAEATRRMASQPDSDEQSEYREGDTREMPPVSALNEVGTKLDLARAYIDMGDPDGARSILEEVVEEGDELQRNEARELLESLD